MKISKAFFFFLVVCWVFEAVNASVVVSGTRFIYREHQKQITIQLQNTATKPALIQAWIDEGNSKSTPENSKAPFIVMPPIHRIEPGHGQSLRIVLTDNSLPRKKESVFWLNILEIPPRPKATEQSNSNYLQMAIRSRLKLFYRPAQLKGKADMAAMTLISSLNDHQLVVRNPSAFHVSLTSIILAVNETMEEVLKSGTMIKPDEQATFTFKKNWAKTMPLGASIHYTYINDYGGRVTVKKQLK